MLRPIAFHRPLFIALVAALLTACATAPPVQEMSDARQAIAAAREAGADQFAARRLAEAEALLNSAEEYLAWDNSSGYWSARRAAVNAKETALDALLISRAAIEDESKPVDSMPAFR